MNTLLLFVALLAPKQYPASPKPVPTAYAKGFASIDATYARELVTKLAGPDFMGRQPATPEFDAAAKWAVERFKEYGLAPAGENGTFFQRFAYGSAETDAATARLELGRESFAYGKDCMFAVTGDVHLRAKLAFVHLKSGETLTEAQKAKLRGRVVIVDERGPGMEELNQAQRHGTLGAMSITVPDPKLSHSRWSYTRPADRPQNEGKLCALDLTPDAAARLAKAAGVTRNGHLETPDAELLLTGKATAQNERISENILAKLPGKSPETVMVGAHLDHLGSEYGQIYWGADDNGSGSAATLMIARAFARNHATPKRTLVFCLWTLEEIGEVGSNHYIRHPTVPLRDTVAYLNMDMVGRDSDGPPWRTHIPGDDIAEDNRDAVFLVSARLVSPELYRLATEANRSIGLNLRDERMDGGEATDIWPFAWSGIPTMGAYDGIHHDYHRPTDTPEKLNYPKMTRVAQWIYLCAQDLANRRGRVRFLANGQYLTGRIRAESDMDLPAGTEFEIELKEGDKVIDKTRIVNAPHLPQRFALRYDAAHLDPAKRYAVSVRTTLNHRVTMASAEVPVLGKGWSANGFEVVLEPLRGSD